MPMSEGVFEMPYSLVKEDIEKSLKSKWKALRKMHKQRTKSEDCGKKINSQGSLLCKRSIKLGKVKSCLLRHFKVVSREFLSVKFSILNHLYMFGLGSLCGR